VRTSHGLERLQLAILRRPKLEITRISCFPRLFTVDENPLPDLQPNVSGCAQTVKSISDTVCAVPLWMLQVPRPEIQPLHNARVFCARTNSKIKSQVKPQTADAGSTADQSNVTGCLGGSDGNYTVAEDGTRQIFKITTSSVDLKAHLGHDVKLIGHKASEAVSSGAADNSFAITELSMISDHCTVAAAAPAATASPSSETVSPPPADAAQPTRRAAHTSRVSAPQTEASAAASATVSPSSDSVIPATADTTTPAATASTPSETVSPPLQPPLHPP